MNFATGFCAAEYRDIGFNHHHLLMKYGQHIWCDQNESSQPYGTELVFQNLLVQIGTKCKYMNNKLILDGMASVCGSVIICEN